MPTYSKRLIWSLLLGAGLGAGCKTVETRTPALIPAAPPAAATASPVNEKSAEQLFSEGAAAYQSGRDEDARLLFTKALERSSRMVNAQYNLGVIAEREGDRAQAAVEYQAALEIDNSHLPSILNLGRIELLDGEYEKAIALFESGLKQPTKEHELALLNNLGAAYRLAKNYAKAESTSRAVLSKHGENVNALKNLALVFYAQSRYRLAELVETSAAKINPKDPGVHNDLGLVHLKLGQPARAVGEFRHALELDPKFEVAHRNLGALALAYRDYPTAQKSFAALVSLTPESYEAHLDYAYALQDGQGLDPSKGMEAAAEFEKALAIQPSPDQPDGSKGERP
ncbi:MAG TPA: tetratricopeptide repeat protein [Myxococcaceae bacterium]|nr:tetratricopeptide repeat protein [Myxococcaceae bacterium]